MVNKITTRFLKLNLGRIMLGFTPLLIALGLVTVTQTSGKLVLCVGSLLGPKYPQCE